MLPDHIFNTCTPSVLGLYARFLFTYILLEIPPKDLSESTTTCDLWSTSILVQVSIFFFFTNKLDLA